VEKGSVVTSPPRSNENIYIACCFGEFGYPFPSIQYADKRISAVVTREETSKMVTEPEGGLNFHFPILFMA
jgi:hypothetical protein